METLNFNNKSINYIKFGKGKKTFVIIPGLSVKSVMESSDLIIDAYNIFSSEYTTYCFDRINDIPNNYSINDMANDYIEAFDALNLKDLYLFGASQGGMILMLIALKRSNLVKKMVIGSSTPIVTSEKFIEINNWINLAKNKLKKELYLSFASLIYPTDFYNKYENIIIEQSKDVTDNDLDRFIICANALKDFNVIDKLKDIKNDILFINDKTDKLLGDISYIYNDLKKDNFKVFVLDGFGHAAYDLAPNYKEIIINFFKEA